MKSKSQIIIIPDKFKESLTSQQVVDSVKSGLNTVLPEFVIKGIALADGGEGSLEVVAKARKVEEFLTLNTYDPLGREISCDVTLCDKVLFIESAKCIGLQLLSEKERNPMNTSSYGLGHLIKEAVENYKITHIYIGIGGSSTNDGGAGMMSALGCRFFDSDQKELYPSRGFRELKNLTEIDITRVKDLSKIKISCVCDVDNPLLGTNGATMVYARQKGANDDMRKELEQIMTTYKTVSSHVLSRDCSLNTGAGAAGGLGYAIMAFMNGELVEGWKFFTEIANIEEEIRRSKYVITGEGQFDHQSLRGKLPAGIAGLCKKYNVPLIIVCGRSTLEKEIYQDMGIIGVYQLNDIEPDIRESMKQAASLLKQLSIKIGKDILRRAR